MTEAPISRLELAFILNNITGSLISLAAAVDAQASDNVEEKTKKLTEFYERVGLLHKNFDELVSAL